MDTDRHASKKDEANGIVYGVTAYGLWGLFPLYWKSLESVPSMQILAHRIVWSFVFTMILSLALGRRAAIAKLFREPKRLAATVLAGVLVSANWGIYIWAVNTERIIETSLGYYLNPLVSVALGTLVLRERIDHGIMVSSVIAGVGIVILTISYGQLPWISLSLAVTFALYGLIKKMAGLDALMGLAMETALVFPFALGFLAYEQVQGRGSFVEAGVLSTVLLVLAGAVTAIPLFFYAEGVKRVPLSRMGFLQYISPTLQLLLGVVVFGEVMSGSRMIAFAFILAALVVFAITRAKRSGTEAARP
ncbi:MAG: EamA family transporter RarD [Spirochaetales bacterium]|nr:EamA family transporter RarD [Spirochaetales bacterium]